MKNLIFLLLSVFCFSQQKIMFDFDASMKDATKTVKSVTIIDQRSSKEPTEIMYKDEKYSFDLAPDFNKQISEKFIKDNKQQGTRDLVVLLEDLSVSENDTGKKTVPAAHFRASTFERKADKYYYITTSDKFVGPMDVQAGMTPKYLPGFLKWDITELLKNSFAGVPSKIELDATDLPNYYSILSSTMPAFTAALKDGVYENAAAFFNQNPAAGFMVERNSEGKIQRAKSGDNKLPAYKIWGYVENGKLYRNTISGFLPVEKDDKGYYILSNRGELEMVPANSTLGMFGLIGGLAAAVDQNAKQTKAKKAEKKNIYIDPLTGAYIF